MKEDEGEGHKIRHFYWLDRQLLWSSKGPGSGDPCGIFVSEAP